MLSSHSRDILPRGGLSSSAAPWDRRGRMGGNDSSLAGRPEGQTNMRRSEESESSLNLKLSFTLKTVEVVAEAPESPVNLPPAQKLNFQIRNKAAQTEVWVPGEYNFT